MTGLKKEYFDKIDKALQVNSFEHQKFRSCQIEIEDNELEVEIADGVKVRVVQSTLADVRSKTEPANDA